MAKPQVQVVCYCAPAVSVFFHIADGIPNDELFRLFPAIVCAFSQRNNHPGHIGAGDGLFTPVSTKNFSFCAEHVLTPVDSYLLGIPLLVTNRITKSLMSKIERADLEKASVGVDPTVRQGFRVQV